MKNAVIIYQKVVLVARFIRGSFVISAFSNDGQSNRLFLILAVALISLICVGLLALGGFFFFVRNNPDQAQVSVTLLPPTAIPPTFTPSATASATPTETPLPTPTGTSVLGGGDGAEAPVDTPTIDLNATATNTAVLQPTLTATLEPTATPTPPPEVIPDSGGILSVANNGFLGWIGSGLLLVLIIYGIFNRFKLLSQDPQK